MCSRFHLYLNMCLPRPCHQNPLQHMGVSQVNESSLVTTNLKNTMPTNATFQGLYGKSCDNLRQLSYPPQECVKIKYLYAKFHTA